MPSRRKTGSANAIVDGDATAPSFSKVIQRHCGSPLVLKTISAPSASVEPTDASRAPQCDQRPLLDLANVGF